MNTFWALFQKVGGKEVLGRYARAHVLLYSFVMTALLGFSRKSLEIVRLAVNHRVLGKLRRKYRREITAFREAQAGDAGALPRQQSRKVWICWLQGMEQAPALVQLCYASVQTHLADRDIVVLTEENYREYVTFPAFIQQKIDSGVITRTHLSDLLRLELLIRYGGTWIDATVFCSGGEIPAYMLEDELFVYQCLKPGLDGHCTAISSWFMTACTNHPILRLTRHLLYRYWETHHKLTDYFLLHDFFQLAIEAYPEEWNRVVPVSNSTPHILLLRLFEPYDDRVWQAVTAATPFHKLSYKHQPEKPSQGRTYYDAVMDKGEV